MKKFLLLSTIFVAGTAWAFGGIGLGVKSNSHKSGVNAIGVHINGEGKADIDIVDSQEEVCGAGILKDRFGHCNICENGNVYLSYMDDPCGTEIEMTGNCKSNKDCESLEGCENGTCFCNLINTEEDGLKPNSGACTAIGEKLGPYNVEGLGSVIRSTGTMSWWAAENWCKAQGKNLIDIADFGCYYDGENLLVEDCGECGGDCFAKGGSGWGTVFSSLIDTFGESPYCWTASNYNRDWKASSYQIAFSSAEGGWFSGDDANNERYAELGYALCR